MVGAPGYDSAILELLDRFKLPVVTKDVNANTVTHYVNASLKKVKRLTQAVEERFPAADVTVRRVAVVSAIGSDLDVPGLLSTCVLALARADINVLALHQNMRAVDIQFVIDEADYQGAIRALHEAAIENTPVVNSGGQVVEIA